MYTVMLFAALNQTSLFFTMHIILITKKLKHQVKCEKLQ